MTEHSVPGRFDKSADGLVGRSGDVVAVLNAVGQSRLTTLLGPGGVGKTRLAREVSAELETEFGHVRFVDLAATAVDPVVGQIESADSGSYAALDAGPTLLIFDNCEHDVERAADLVARLMRQTSSVCVVATSRRPLHIGGERIVAVRPLSVPLGEKAVTELAAYESVQLFVERVTQADPDFVLSAANGSEVTEICRLSDGLPMVLELAAGLARSQSLASVAEAMLSGQDLATKRRDIHPHQQTVGRSVDWSIALLRGSARLVLQCAATFRGSFTFEAIDMMHQAVGGGSTAGPIDELVEHSLVQFSSSDNRYRLLEVVAGSVRGSCTAEQAVKLQEAHLEWCEHQSRQIRDRMYAADPDQTFGTYRLDLADLDWAARQLADDPARWLQLIGRIAPWWVNHGGPVDLDVWKEIHGKAELSPAAVNVALGIAFRLGHVGKLEEMAAYGERALADADRLDRPDLQIAALWVTASAHQNLGNRAKAVTTYERALAIYEGDDEAGDGAPSSYLLGLVRVGLAEALEPAAAKREQLWLVVELSRSTYPALHIAATQVLAKLELQDQNFEAAVALLEPNIVAAVEVGFDEAAGTSHNIAGEAARLAGSENAEEHYRSGLHFGQRIGHSGVIADSLMGLAELCIAGRYVDEAVALVRRAQSLASDVSPSDELRSAVADTAAGRSSPDMSELLHQLPTPILALSGSQAQSPQVALTERELAVLRLLRGDLTQREIADELYVSASTVRTHVKSIYKKLGVHNRSGCVYEATVRGLIESPS